MDNLKLHKIYLPHHEKGDRAVWVYVPQYDEGENLPVVYMTDGQNLFEENSPPFGCWNIEKAVENEILKTGRACVIVGIDNGNEWRDNELTPNGIGTVIMPDSMENYTKSEGEIFDDFLMNTVIPFVEQNFPVRTDKNGMALCGSSSGGLQAFFTGIEHSDRFSFVGAFSPAFLLYSRDSWRDYLISKVSDDMPYMYIYTGNGDELEQQIFESVEMLYDLLPEVFYPYDKMNEVILFENCHNEKAWAEIFPDFLHTFLNLHSIG